jgi:tetratricopeptide (TPR) repeat protein
MSKVLVPLILASILFGAAYGQQPTAQLPMSAEKLAPGLVKKLDGTARDSISTADRARAYAKFLEAQRYFWRLSNSRRGRTPAVYQGNVRTSREALLAALELNPYIAEAYTILAELSISAPPNDIDDAIELARLAVRVEQNNFGARRILGRLHTFKSALNSKDLNTEQAALAIAEWKRVAALDPRNAEAWGFLSLFYEKTSKPKERIEALQNWVSAAPALDGQFFQRVTGGSESLTPENASLKLGEALITEGRTTEAISILGQLIADDSSNSEAIDLLREAVTSAKGTAPDAPIQALRQAVYANPGNVSLTSMLAELYADSGKLADGVKLLRDAAANTTDRASAGMYLVLLGDLYDRVDSYADATAAYELALSRRGLSDRQPSADDERAFLMQVYQRLVRSAKRAGRSNDVQTILERARRALGPNEDFADRELISFYREGGKRQEALAVIRGLRTKSPGEEGLARLEATLITELGRVDEAVAGFRSYIADRAKSGTNTNPKNEGGSATFSVAPPVDEFSTLLFISQLYTQASRTKEAIDSANQALTAARGPERRQIARLTLASAQQTGGDHAGAEATLRDILKESPDNPIALNNLGYFLIERNLKLEEALKMIQEAVGVDPTNPSYLDSLGWAYFKLGKLAEAEKYLKDAAKFDPLSSTITEHLGDVYLKQGRGEEARRLWQKALELASEKSDVERIKVKLK